MLLGAFVPRFHQVSRDIHAQHVRAKFRGGNCRGAVAAAEIEDLHTFLDADSLDEGLATLAHGRSDAREIAFFPQCFIRIHWNAHINVIVLRTAAPPWRASVRVSFPAAQ